MPAPRPDRLSRLVVTACTGLALVACTHHAPRTTVTTASATGDVTASMPAAWAALLVPFTGLTPGIHGRADITLTGGGQPATVLLFLTGLQPNMTYVWHIRHGPCSTSEPQGPPSEYAPLSVDAQGRGTATGIFPVTDKALGTYHIDVHPIGAFAVACGSITPR